MEKASKEYRLEVAQELQRMFERFGIKVKDAGLPSRKIKVELKGKHPHRPGGMSICAPTAWRLKSNEPPGHDEQQPKHTIPPPFWTCNPQRITISIV